MKLIINGESVGFNPIRFNKSAESCMKLSSANFNYLKNVSRREILHLDYQIGLIKKNKKKYLELVIFLAIVLPSATLNAYASSLNPYVSGGFMGTPIGIKGLEMLKTVAQGVCVIGWIVELIKSALTGTLDTTVKSSTKWASFALIIKFLPGIVDWIFNV